MNTEDRFDDLIRERLRASAPNEAPARVLEGTMTRISDNRQGGRGWLGGTAGRLLAAAAVLLVAVLAGTQLAGLIDRPTGADPSPSLSAFPSVAPSATVSPSTSPEAQPTESPVGAADELLFRVQYGGGGPTSPIDMIPWLALMADGRLIWQPALPEPVYPSLVTRQLTQAGLDALREGIFGAGLFEQSADHELERRPDAPEPPGRGVGVFLFTAATADGEVIVHSVEWLGDEEESTYYEPSPEREALDALARALRDPEAMLDADAWAGPSEAYEATDYQVVLQPMRDVPAYGNLDVSALPLQSDGPLDEYGEEAGDPRPPLTRCGGIGRDEASAIVASMREANFDQADLSGATIGSLDWAEGNGIVDLVLVPRMPDGFPGCADQPG